MPYGLPLQLARPTDHHGAEQVGHGLKCALMVGLRGTRTTVFRTNFPGLLMFQLNFRRP